MSYQSIDSLQKTLASSVFSTKSDAKKAAGRALGTIVEIITYYLLREWGYENNIAIETKLPEFGNKEITHNVEFTLHKLISSDRIEFDTKSPLTASNLRKKFEYTPTNLKTHSLLDSNSIVKNSAIIGEDTDSIGICNIIGNSIAFSRIRRQPSIMFECKRVGVEDGQKKGPQTIEKAKQGAYVALKSSSLQKIRDVDGKTYGVYFKDNRPIIEDYEQALNDCLRSSTLDNFILTFGIISNHGNWFTSSDMNKELKVLAQSFDRLLFLTDEGLSTFIEETIMNPQQEYYPIRKAFIESYTEGKKNNRFTKSRISRTAHDALCLYFHLNITKIENWFNIISPSDISIKQIRAQITKLLQ